MACGRERLGVCVACASACSRSSADFDFLVDVGVGQWPHDGRLAIGHLDDVIAELGLDEIADLAGCERERGGVERGRPCGRARSSRDRRPAARCVSSCEYFFASAAKSPPAFASFSTCFGLRAHRRVVFAFGRQQDVARANLLGRRVLAELLVVVPLDVFLRHLDASLRSRRD